MERDDPHADTGLPSDSSMSMSPNKSSPSRRQQQRINFPQASLSSGSPSSETGTGPSALPSSPIGAGLRSLNAQGRRPNRLSQAAILTTEPFVSQRRRVRSVGNASDTSAVKPSSSYSRSQYVSGTVRSSDSARRFVNRDAERPPRPGTASIGSSPLAAGAILPAEEDTQESSEDTRILAELRNALQFKPHVEQHLKGNSPLSVAPVSTLPSTTHTTPSNMSPIPFGSRSLLPVTIPLSEPQTPSRAELVDFSPSVGTASLHPIPSSSDDCATLDWSLAPSEDERRDRKWTLSLTRKPSSDKHMKLSRKALVEKQEISYSGKLSRIRERLEASTQRKADIVKIQLQRRYAALNASYSSGVTPLNLLKAVRWFNEQSAAHRQAITEEDPAPWLTHLHGLVSNGRERYNWAVTALIVERYLQATDPRFVFPTTLNDFGSDTSSYISAPVVQGPTRPISLLSTDQRSMARKSDDMLLFEPLARSRTGSVDASSRASGDTHSRRWRNSLGTTEERERQQAELVEDFRPRHQTTSSDQSRVYGSHASPLARRSLQTFGVKKRSLQSPAGSDGEKSSGGELRDRSEKRNTPDSRRSRFHLSLDLRSNSVGDDKQRGVPAFTMADFRTDASPSSRSHSQGLPNTNPEASVSTEAFHRAVKSNSKMLGPAIDLTPIKTPKPPMQSLSLPPNNQLHAQKTGLRRRRGDEALDKEYKRKRELLDTLTQRNARLKQSIGTAARTIKDHEESQQVLSKRLGIPYMPLSREVLDAFSHDPSSVIGHLKHLKGWRAVEEIHNRLTSQRQILNAFVSRLSEEPSVGGISEMNFYEGAISEMNSMLDRLQARRESTLSKFKQTHELLAQVKRLRDELKPEFDETSKHTSASYSELVRLESLLDEIVNEKNPFWHVFEAVLSFLLSSVAPLMKTFGRPIWNELHDFLVIPLYRNDFSGEDAWYPVTFPKREFFHWVRLILFAIIVPLALVNGLLLFINIMTEGYFIRVPPFVPSSVVLVLFWALMCSFASLLSTLFVVVLCEIFILFWWTAWFCRIVK